MGSERSLKNNSQRGTLPFSFKGGRDRTLLRHLFLFFLFFLFPFLGTIFYKLFRDEPALPFPVVWRWNGQSARERNSQSPKCRCSPWQPLTPSVLTRQRQREKYSRFIYTRCGFACCVLDFQTPGGFCLRDEDRRTAFHLTHQSPSCQDQCRIHMC